MITNLLERAIPDDRGCWNWKLSKLPNGYGRVGGKRGRLAHRWAWTVAHGAIPEGLCVLHKCDNRACVNPDHLFLGTKRDNTQDALRKGRLSPHKPSDSPRWKPGRPIGERNGSAKLNRPAVEAIRRQYRDGALQRELASKYGVSQVAISQVVRGGTWA